MAVCMTVCMAVWYIPHGYKLTKLTNTGFENLYVVDDMCNC